MRRVTIAATLLAGTALFAAPAAIAAPTGSVVVNQPGTSSTAGCSVTSVLPLQVRELPRVDQRSGIPVAPLSTATHVGVQC